MLEERLENIDEIDEFDENDEIDEAGRNDIEREVREESLLQDEPPFADKGKKESGRKADKDIDIFKCYMDDISGYALLTKDEETILLAKASKGDEQARNDLINANQRLVVSIAKKYGSSRAELMDFIQEGNLGLLEAIGKFDLSKNYAFSTYACFVIRQYMSRFITDNGRMIRVPSYVQLLDRNQRKATDKLREELGREPEPEEIAEYMGIPVEKLFKVNELMLDAGSLDITTGEDGDSGIIDIIPDDNAASPESEVCNSDLRRELSKQLDMLNDDEKVVLYLAFGLGGEEENTLEDIHRMLDVDTQIIKRIKIRAFEKLKRMPGVKQIKKDYLDTKK